MCQRQLTSLERTLYKLMRSYQLSISPLHPAFPHAFVEGAICPIHLTIALPQVVKESPNVLVPFGPLVCSLPTLLVVYEFAVVAIA